jgi:hypothetical protein
MKRRMLAVAGGALALIILSLAWSGFPGLAREKNRHTPTRAPLEGTGAETPRATPAPRSPTRDLFLFSDERTTGATAPAARAGAPGDTPVASTPPTPVAPVRLVGFVRSQGRAAAVLAIDSTIELAKVGDEVHGYRVLSLDEDLASARLRAPDGQEIEIATPSS